MAQGETVMTIEGNLTADPELRYTQSSVAVASFTVASTPRNFDRTTNEFKDGETLYMRCSVWREMAENVTGSLSKGAAVIVTGRLKQKSYQTKEGENRTSIELEVDNVGPSLKFATASVTRVQTGSKTQRENAAAQGATGGAERWADPTPDAGNAPWNQPYGDETPF